MTAGTSQQPLAEFTFVEHFARWHGNIDCAFEHQYDGASWMTVRITNVSQATVSFDYTIAFHLTVSGSVESLPIGVSSEMGLCNACASPPYDPIVIDIRNIRYGP